MLPEPVQLTDPAKNYSLSLVMLVFCSAVHGDSSAESNKPLQEKIWHTQARQECGVDHSSHAISSCWGTTVERTRLILKHSMSKIQKCFTTIYAIYRISKERLPQMAKRIRACSFLAGRWAISTNLFAFKLTQLQIA